MKRLFRKKSLWIVLFVVLLGSAATWAFKPADHYFAIVKSLDIFASVFRDLDAYYVDSIQPEDLINTGIEAMTGSLDPYTYFYAEDDLDNLAFQATGKYAGVGISILQEGDSTLVGDVYEGSPMQQAGIKVGDILLSLDGKTLHGLSEQAVSDLLKGEPGTVLEVAVRNPVSGKERALKIRRAEINIQSVPYAGLLADHIGYIKMAQFTEYSSHEVETALRKMMDKDRQLQGLVLDLRNNPGGLLEEAVKTANLFIDEGKTIVSTHGKVGSWNRVYKTSALPLDDSLHLVILTNRMTASASEIVAGAVQDMDRGLIVGQRSFGKGLVQTTRDLPYHTKIKITTARYYTPSGRCIQAIDYMHRHEDGSVGLIPDSLKKEFRTEHGRIVSDGGGIAPDVETKPVYFSNIAITLLKHNYIFDYATQYCYAHPSEGDKLPFSLGEAGFSDFMKFMDGKDYVYKTRSEMALDDFKKAAEEEQYFAASQKEFDALQSKVKHDKHQDILKHKDEIRHLLEEEIASRYQLREGRIMQGLPYDPAVQKALALLQQPSAYDSLLHLSVAGQ